MKIQTKTDWVDYVLLALAVMFIGLCVVVVKEAKAHHEAEQLVEESTGWTPPEIPKVEGCELWDRIRYECDDN